MGDGVKNLSGGDCTPNKLHEHGEANTPPVHPLRGGNTSIDTVLHLRIVNDFVAQCVLVETV